MSRSSWLSQRRGRGWALEDGENVTRLAKIMGPSLVQIEDTYFRWLQRTDDELRARFDSFDAREEVAHG